RWKCSIGKRPASPRPCASSARSVACHAQRPAREAKRSSSTRPDPVLAPSRRSPRCSTWCRTPSTCWPGDIRTDGHAWSRRRRPLRPAGSLSHPLVILGDMSVLVEAHDRVEARVAEIMGTLNAATAALVRTIGEVLEHDTWTTAAGIKSPEHWVTWQCGVSHARAEALVRVARRRSELPKSAALFDAGQITEDVMAAIARRGCAERDVEIAEQAHRLLYSQVDRMLRTMPQPERP